MLSKLEIVDRDEVEMSKPLEVERTVAFYVPLRFGICYVECFAVSIASKSALSSLVLFQWHANFIGLS